jgi:hypothetical protein
MKTTLPALLYKELVDKHFDKVDPRRARQRPIWRLRSGSALHMVQSLFERPEHMGV